MHEISGISVEVDEAGVARRPGSANLAGSTGRMPSLIRNLSQNLELGEGEIAMLVDRNPRIALNL
jgi:N-acetylglucosamine-6-phosphate deacetylase